MIRGFSIGVVLVCLIGFMALSGVPLTKDAIAADSVTLKVYDPMGAIAVTQLFSPRLADLSGKTLCELSNDSWEASRTFPAIRELLQRQFPTTKIIPYTEFPKGTAAIDNDKIGDMVKAKGCQGVIVGNAG
jgi:hypothetical protein